MKVAPIKKKFGRYQPGEAFDLPDKAAKIFIKAGKLEQVQSAPTYQTRMMTAEQAAPATVTRPLTYSEKPQVFPGTIIQSAEAPYGYKTDGTPRKRPGRTKASE